MSQADISELRRAIKLQTSHLGDGFEVSAVLVEFAPGLEAGRGDHTVNQPSDADTPFSTRSVNLSSMLEGHKAPDTHNWELPKELAGASVLPILNYPLEHFAVDDIGKGNGRSSVDQSPQLESEGSSSSLQEINPHAGIDDDHTRPRRSSSRSPSHLI